MCGNASLGGKTKDFNVLGLNMAPCDEGPLLYMALTVPRVTLQKVLRCKVAGELLIDETSHLQQKIITVTVHSTSNKAAL